MKTVQSPENISWGTGDDPKRFTDQLMEQLGIDEMEVSRMLLDSLFQHGSREQALENFKKQFPHLPVPEFTPSDQAMQLVSQAQDALANGKNKQAKTLLNKALKLDPNCADAYLLEVDMLPEDGPFSETYDLLQKALSAGKLAIGSQEEFDANVGEFWRWTVTRPYMRALETLTRTCWAEQGYTDKAIGHALEMLRLNPNDNQGIRQCLLYWLMAKDRWDEAEHLWKQYEESYNAWWIYGRSLLTAYREGAKSSAAKKDFGNALEYNPFVVMILLMEDSQFLRSLMQDSYSPGNPSEAAYMATDLMMAQTQCLQEELAESAKDCEEELPTLMRLFYDMVEQITPQKFDKTVRKAMQAIRAEMEAE